MVLGNYYLTLEETKEDLLARAGRRKAKGDIEEYELFTVYGESEGKLTLGLFPTCKGPYTRLVYREDC